MFGQPAANTFGANTQGNSLFGQSNTNTTGAFGGTTQTGGFGQPTTGTTFGQPTTGTTFGQPTTGTTFGQPATGTTFGQPANNTFGQPTSNTFGNQTTTGFGASTFGQNKPTLTLNTGVNQPKPTTSLFGNTQTNTGFGQNKTGFGQSNIFGGQPAQQTNMFGQSTFGQQQNQFQSQTFQNNNQQAQALDQVKAAASAFDPSSPACVFKHYFYNMVHQSEVGLYQPSPNEDRSLYEQAQQQNPDPTCMVPVLAVGFDGLKKRSEIQNEQLATHKEKLAEIQEKIVKLEQTRTISTIIKIEEYKRKHRQLVHKVFQLLKSVQLLRNKGYILRPEEEALITRLISMDRDLAKPSVFRGRINEIWAQVQQFKDVEPVSVSIDPQSIKPLYSALEGMGKGLMELTNVCREDDSTLSQIERAYMEASLK